jgi:hypothetical protein
MALTDNGRCIEAASKREMAAPGRMLADLSAALAKGMAGWQDSVGDPQSLHDALMAVIEARSGGAEVVAEADGDATTVYDRDMGTASRRYAGLSAWPRKRTDWTVHVQRHAWGLAATLATRPCKTSGDDAEDLQRRVDAQQDDGDAADDQHRVEKAAAMNARISLLLAQVPDGHDHAQ